MTSLQPGDKLQGKYEILQPLGTGGWGTAYLAENIPLGLQVAIKSLKRGSDLEDYDQVHQRFEQEARIGARLTHPNIVRVYELIEDDYDLYLVMEYAEGGTLADRLKAAEPLLIGEALYVSIAICQALDYVHRHSIVHGDVRPSNILLVVDRDTTGEHIVYKLSDFGFAVDTRQENLQEMVEELDDLRPLGAWPYTSPERLKREPFDGRTDIYSLGIVLYEMLTGVPPFPLKSQFREAVDRVIESHLKDPPVSPRRKRYGLCIQVNQTVLKMLEKELVNRYEDAGGLLEALHTAREPQEQWEKELEGRYQEAIGLFDQKKWQSATDRFEELLADNAPYDDLQKRLDEARRQVWTAETFEEALHLMEGEKWKEAIRKWDEILVQDENYGSGEARRQRDEAEIQIDLADKYRQALELERRKQWEQAIKLFSTILAKRPGYADVSDRLAKAEKRRRIQTNYKTGIRHLERQEWDKAIKRLQTVVDEDLTYRDAAVRLEWVRKQRGLEPLYQEGVKYFELQEWFKASQKFQEIVNINPGYKDSAQRLHQVKKIMRESQPTPSVGTLESVDTGSALSPFDWKKILWMALGEGTLGAIITKLVDIYVGTLSPLRLIFLGLGIVMIMIAITLIYETFIRPSLR